MGFSRYYLKDYRFMLTRITGDMNDHNSMEHIIAHNREADGITDLRELTNGRKIDSMAALTVQGVIECAMLAQERPQGLLALLVPDSALYFGLARVFQTFTEKRSRGVRIFKNIDAAVKWLSNSEAELAFFAQFIKDADQESAGNE